MQVQIQLYGRVGSYNTENALSTILRPVVNGVKVNNRS